MKKLLGLLLNCAALCLCSAIGIGAGMYWIKTTQQNSSPVPMIQQAEGVVIQPVQQTPNLISLPGTSQSLNANQIPTEIVSQQQPLKQVASATEAEPTGTVKTLITLKVNGKIVGSLNPDTNGTTDPPNREFYLSKEELASISFDIKLQSSTGDKLIEGVTSGVSGNSNIALDKKTATYSIPSQNFGNSPLEIKVALSLTGDVNPSQTFTFKINPLPSIDSITLTNLTNPPVDLLQNSSVTMPGPNETIEIKMKGPQTISDIYSLKIQLAGKSTKEVVSETYDDSNKIHTHKLIIKSAGNYTVTLTERNKTQPYQTRKFTISPIESVKPFISQVTDAGTDTEILYDRSVLAIKQIPAYLMRNNKLKLVVPALSGGRTRRVKYRKVTNPGQATENKGEFQVINSTGTSNDFSIDFLSHGTYEIQAEDIWMGPLNPPKELNSQELAKVDRIRVIIPESAGNFVLEPTIISYKNQKYPQSAEGIPVTGIDSIIVYGEYLELSGNNGYPDHKPQFLLFNEVIPKAPSPVSPAPSTDLTIEKLEVATSGHWHATLRFKKVNEGTKRVLYVRTINGVHHAYSANALTLTSMKASLEQKPDLTKFKLINSDNPEKALSANAMIYENTSKLGIKARDITNDQNLRFLVFTETQTAPIGEAIYLTDQTADFNVDLKNGQHRIFIKFAQGGAISTVPSDTFTLNLQKNGLEVKDVEPPNFGTAPGIQQLKITFSSGNPLDIDTKTEEGREKSKKWFRLVPSKNTGIFQFGNSLTVSTLNYIEHENAVVLSFANLTPDIYQLEIVGSLVKDKFGNLLEGTKGVPGTNYVRVLNKPDAGSSDSIPPEVGISEFVEYRDYEKREPTPPGFNPSDRVVTRVARLYYYRDAHRVAQILNSEVQSLNHKGYHQAQILADKARTTYQTTVKQRRIQEEKSIRAAKDLREKENDYRNQQQILGGLVRERAKLEEEEDDNTGKKTQLDNAITAAQGQLTSLRTDISRLSGIMNTEDDKLKSLKLEEDQLSATLFQREVQAEKTDLYTIANGHPDSYDAVRQVTIKVIGEGLIHLRGPIKGVNILRTMINQIDSPVGQVRIAMHTIQINGEDGKRMENVADRIQKSIDQSRFLTVQSAQMLRKAIISVASEVAISTCQEEGIGFTQEQRDQKYLYAFFGRDFIQALQEMNSEFLQSGNKMLSIHSMDTTSLSSALFVLALAKNEIRQQILAQFYASIETELPNAEYQFLYQGGPTKATKHKVKLLSQFAHFQSFKGFFDHNVIGTDTMTPIQREFVRLAQIFKAKLTTERELRLHVMERAVIEQRMDDYKQELKDARQKEKVAKDALTRVQKSIQESQIEVVKTITGLQAQVSQTSNQFESINSDFATFQNTFNEIINEILTTALGNKIQIDISSLSKKRRADLLMMLFPVELENKKGVFRKRIFEVLDEFYKDQYDEYKNIIKKLDNKSAKKQYEKLPITSEKFNEEIREKIGQNLQQQFPKGGSGSKGRFKYGTRQFTFYIDDGGKFWLTPEEDFKEMKKITDAYIKQSTEVVKKLNSFELNQNMKLQLRDAEELQLKTNKIKDDSLRDIHRVAASYFIIQNVAQQVATEARKIFSELQEVNVLLSKAGTDSQAIQNALVKWRDVNDKISSFLKRENELYKETAPLFKNANQAFNRLVEAGLNLKFAEFNAQNSRQQLDHKKFLDMQIDQAEDRYIDLVEGTRSHTANIDNYLKRIATALEDDFNTQFYTPAFRAARDASRYWNVSFGSIETSSILTNNRSLGKVAPKATMEFDLPKRQLAIIEGMNIAQAAVKEYGALVNDPTFLAITSMNGGENVQGGFTIPPDSLEKQVLGQPGSQGQKFGSAFENLIPDPAVFKFETGTGFTVRPVIQPDGQSVIFDLNYLYRTNVREPVRADEKHLGRIKEHFIDTDVQLGNYELREISRFVISLKATRTGNGVPLLSDVPGVGVLFRPTPSAESSLQQSQIMSQAVIFPTLFDLMGLRWAPAVADVGPLQLTNREFISKGRDRYLKNRVYDYAGSKVDEFLRIQETERRSDLYRTQQTIPDIHPNGYMGPGLNLKRSRIQENYDAERQNPPEKYAPESIRNGVTDPNRAVPVIPSSPRFEPLPEIPPTVPPSSALPMKDLNLKPASWSPTEPKSLPAKKGKSSPYLKTNGISSPRRIPSKANEVKAIINTKNRQQPPAPKRSSFYKRSASRIKSYFKKK